MGIFWLTQLSNDKRVDRRKQHEILLGYEHEPFLVYGSILTAFHYFWSNFPIFTELLHLSRQIPTEILSEGGRREIYKVLNDVAWNRTDRGYHFHLWVLHLWYIKS